MSGQQEPVLLLDVSTPQGPELHQDVSTLHRPVLLLVMSMLQGLSCTWTYLDNSRLCCFWMCPHHRASAAPRRVYTTGACAAPGHDWSTGACAAPGHVRTAGLCAAPGRVYTVKACAAPGPVYTAGPELHLDMSVQQEPMLLLDVSTPKRP